MLYITASGFVFLSKLSSLGISGNLLSAGDLFGWNS